MAQRSMGLLPIELLPHPTPHPPAVALLSLPFGLLPYPWAAAAWLALEASLAILLLYLLLRETGLYTPRRLILTGLLFLVWSTVKDELTVGQLMVILCGLLSLVWVALRRGKEGWAGFLAGTVFALKLFAWPILIYFALTRRWKAVVWSGIAAIGWTLAAAQLAGGVSKVIPGYIQALVKTGPLYQAHERNFSVWSLGYRLFSGTGSPASAGIEAPPLINYPNAAGPVSLLLVLLVLAVGLFWALRSPRLDTSFGILICTSLLVSPIAWSHYLLLAAIPLFAAIGLAREERLSPRQEGALAILLVACFTAGGWRGFFLLGGEELGSMRVSFGASLITLIPTAAIAGLLILLSRVNRKNPVQSLDQQPGQQE
jgi:hypothetical protein